MKTEYQLYIHRLARKCVRLEAAEINHVAISHPQDIEDISMHPLYPLQTHLTNKPKVKPMKPNFEIERVKKWPVGDGIRREM